MSNESTAAIIKKLSIRNGLLLAGIYIVISLVFWAIDPIMQYTNTWASMLLFIVPIVLLVVFGLEIRKAAGGYWTFGEAFKSLLLMSVILAILSIVFHYLLNAIIDPTLPQRTAEAIAAKLSDQLSSAGMSQSKIDEVVQKIEEKSVITLKNELINLGIAIIIYAVIDLIIAAIIKKNRPMFTPIEETDPTV